jgi:hypothetical protein
MKFKLIAIIVFIIILISANLNLLAWFLLGSTAVVLALYLDITEKLDAVNKSLLVK